METLEAQDACDLPPRARAAPARPLHPAPLVRLLRYLRAHPSYTLLTVCFGTAGFLLSFVYPLLIGNLVDLALTPTSASRNAELVRLTQYAAITGVLHAITLYGRGHFNVHLSHAIVTDLRRDLFAHLQRLSARFYAQERTGAIMSRVLHDVHEATSLIYSGVVVAVLDAAQLTLAFVLLTMLSYELALACCLVFPLYGVVFYSLNPYVRMASERLNAQLAELSANMAEQLAGQALVKTYTAEEREAQKFDVQLGKVHGLVMAQSRAGHLVAACGEVLVHLGTTIVIGYGGWLMLRGELTPGTLTRFLGYVVVLYGPVRRFAELNTTYQSSLSAMRRVTRVLDIEPAVTDRKAARTIPPERGSVRFVDVSFHYGEAAGKAAEQLDLEERDGGRASCARQQVLHAFNLDVSAGERVAIVGASGAGKTTLASLLPRLHDVTGGAILVDGLDVRDYTLRALRSAIAIVQQDSFVFSGTIRENLRYGRPGASDREVEAAAMAAHAHDFIVRLPRGYDARVGERGINLSGGQRQRLSIARALLKDPRILILDEATSSLDVESEAIVQQALERLMSGRTCFVIAHRLSTVRNADRIVVLEHGRIVESGGHEALMSLRGIYARLVGAHADATLASA